MGLCPKPCLGDFLRRSHLRTFKTFTARGLCLYFYVVQILSVVIFRAANSGCYEVNPASGIDTAVASLRYRLEVVGELVADLAERPMCRSVLGESIHMWALANIKGKEMRT